MKKGNKIKNNKVVFDEKTDSSINGFALVFAFIIVGIILQFDNSFFGNTTPIIQASFIVCGIFGLFTEIKKLNIRHNIKGLYDIGMGIFWLVCCYMLKNYIDPSKWFEIFSTLYEVGLFLLILLSIFGFCKGIIEMVYSIYINYKEKHKKENLFSSIMIVLSQLLGLVLILAQIYDVFK